MQLWGGGELTRRERLRPAASHSFLCFTKCAEGSPCQPQASEKENPPDETGLGSCQGLPRRPPLLPVLARGSSGADSAPSQPRLGRQAGEPWCAAAASCSIRGIPSRLDKSAAGSRRARRDQRRAHRWRLTTSEPQLRDCRRRPSNASDAV